MKTCAFVLSLFLLPVDSFFIQLHANEEECFYEIVPASTTMILTAEVVDGVRKMDVVVYGPDGNRMHESTGNGGIRVNINAHLDGEYRYCFSNGLKSISPIVVMFSMRVVTKAEKVVGSEEDQLLSLSSELSKFIDEISEEQRYMEARDEVHRQVNDETGARIVIWSVFEAALVISMTVGQVFYLKRILEVRNVV